MYMYIYVCACVCVSVCVWKLNTGPSTNSRSWTAGRSLSLSEHDDKHGGHHGGQGRVHSDPRETLLELAADAALLASAPLVLVRADSARLLVPSAPRCVALSSPPPPARAPGCRQLCRRGAPVAVVRCRDTHTRAIYIFIYIYIIYIYI